MDVRPRISRGRTDTRTKLVGASCDATASTGSRPLSNHALPGVIVRAGASATVTSSAPASQLPTQHCGAGRARGDHRYLADAVARLAGGEAGLAVSGAHDDLARADVEHAVCRRQRPAAARGDGIFGQRERIRRFGHRAPLYRPCAPWYVAE